MAQACGGKADGAGLCAVAAAAAAPGEGGTSVVILFYRYMSMTSEEAAALAAEQRRLGEELALRGRVLVASEGINGTVQGTREAACAYEASVRSFFGEAVDFKRSEASAEAVFPDFAVKEVPELVSFGLQPSVKLDVTGETAVHLKPTDFHRLLEDTPQEELCLLDVRNSFEYEVGHFEGARDPGMLHTAQWPRYVDKHLQEMQGKRVMMYCTGGIRCEKASAYLRRRLEETPGAEAEVFQLEGGIHRYLEAFPDGGKFRGANFVFDKRAKMRPEDAEKAVIGKCSECRSPWDAHHGGRVCCVCRALVLVCDACDAASAHGEYYCAEHDGLRGFYFHFVDRYGAEELARQASELRSALAAEVGTHRKNRRNTLRKKAEQVEARLAFLRGEDAVGAEAPEVPPRRCRACERPYADCPGECWGFWKRDVGPEAAEAA